MQTIQIDNAEIESFIQSQYGNDKVSLINDFISFVKTELVVNDLKKGFDEVTSFQKNKNSLLNAKDFLSDLKSGN